MRCLLSISWPRWAARAGRAFSTGCPAPRTVDDRPASRRHAHALPTRRSGVSLLEVTFSIGVVMIGLLGIASLLPLGGALARKGAIADAGAQLGANVAREFTARGMANPQSWRWYNSSTAQFTTVVLPNGITPRPGTSFCLDPAFITAADPTLPTYANEMTARARFPLNVVYDSTIPSPMPRITLGSGFTPTGVLDATVANSLFLGTDDLVFDLPGDRTLGPVQNFSFLNAAPANPLKRNSQGRISWMATIVPKLDRLGSGMLTPTDEYTLSIVVFSQRPIDRALYDDSGNLIPENLVSERVAKVKAFYSGDPAFGGGDVTLATRNETRGKDDLELRNGDWVLFSGVKTAIVMMPPPAPPAPPQTPTPVPVQVHRWYRIVQAGEDPQFILGRRGFPAHWARDVTVVGPDWDTANIITPTQVTIVRGVIQVLERTIRLETSSLWTN